MLHGDCIVLRSIEREDLPNYVKWFGDPVVLEFFGPVVPMSQAEEEQWYERMLQDPSTCNFAVEYDGQHVGGAGFSSIDGRSRSAEVGLFIGIPDLWDQGLGRDTQQTLLHYGFEQLNLHRIYLRVFAGNSRATHLYETVGLKHEGCWREAEFRHGGYHDLLWMSILEDEWSS